MGERPTLQSPPPVEVVKVVRAATTLQAAVALALAKELGLSKKESSNL